MDYEKKYKNALEWARQVMTGETGFIRKEVEEIFPELKESEDEIIRKDILAFIRREGQHIDKYKWHKWIAWLERQGEQKSVMNVPSREIILSIWYLGNEWKELTNGSISTEYGTQLDYIQKHWQESEYYLRTKQSEQKPAGKIEPKFKVWDWVIDKQGIVHQIANVIENVTCHTYGYDIVGGGYFNDNTEGVRLWTIQDAKDGDVLQLGKVTAIFKEFIGNGNCRCYCSVCNGEFEIPSQDGADNRYGYHNAIPATKEQCDLLFQKMKEAGYEWDEEEKRLIKVPKTKEETGVLKQLIDNVKFNWGDKVVTENSAWNEEDEVKINRIVACLENLNVADYDILLKDVDWLKSLKERIGG